MCRHQCDTVDRILHPERYEDESPWIPTTEDLAFEPHSAAGDATSSSETRETTPLTLKAAGRNEGES